MPADKKLFDNELIWEANNAPVGINRNVEFPPKPKKEIRFGEAAKPKMKINGDLVIDTVGIELESLFLSQKEVMILLETLPPDLRGWFKVTRDASSEIRVFNIPNGRKTVRISYQTPEARQFFRGHNHEVIGYEAVSKPMDINTAEAILHLLLPKLEMAGDGPNSRCAFHVHVGMAKNLDICKKGLHIGLYVDDLLFRLAGMGGKYRGVTNNSIYARPLISGPYASDGDNWYQIGNYEQALKADTFNEFWYSFGINPLREFGKYVSARYFAFNVLSTLIHGTLEFRYWNQSFDPLITTSVTKLSQMIAEIVLKSRTSAVSRLPIGDPFKDETPSYYVEKLFKMIGMANDLECSYGLEDRHIRCLTRIIENAPPLGLKDVPVKTHLRDYIVDTQIAKLGGLKKLRSGNPVHPGNKDIHNLEDQNILEG